MKKLGHVLFVVVLMGMFLSGCQDNIEIGKNNETFDYPPMVMVDQILYKDTGFVDNYVICGTPDGKIETTVDAGQLPNNNDESNFGKGYSYQFGGEHTINVLMEEEWIIFTNVDYNEALDVRIYQGVACFDGHVIEVDQENGSLLVNVDEIPERFNWILDVYDISEPIKPVRIALDTRIYPEQDTNIELNKKVRIYFDGKLHETNPTLSVPISCNEVYAMEVLED